MKFYDLLKKFKVLDATENHFVKWHASTRYIPDDRVCIKSLTDEEFPRSVTQWFKDRDIRLTLGDVGAVTGGFDVTRIDGVKVRFYAYMHVYLPAFGVVLPDDRVS